MHKDPRGTRVVKKVINLDDGRYTRYVMCAWDDCEKDGFELHKARVNYGKPGHPPHVVCYVFCSERHKQFWINNHRSYGNLPSGAGRSF